MTKVFCAYCGGGLQPGARFCGSCGNTVSASGPSGLDAVQDAVAAPLREMLLADKITGSEILRSPVFRFVFFLAMGPLAIALLPTSSAILEGLAVYSALLWALLFYRLFADRDLAFRWAIGTVLFTCFVMVPILKIYLWLPPDITGWLTTRAFLPLRLSGYVLGVGLREELCKAAPLLALALLTRRLARPLNGLVLGMMSGVGFAAAENVYYVWRTVSFAAKATAQTGELANLVMPVYNNVVRMTMGPFVHACLTGIFGYFIALGASGPVRRIAFLVAGLLLSSTLHGLYDTGVETTPVFGLVIQGITYFLLMTYVLKARGLSSARQIGGGVFQRTVMLQVPEGLPLSPTAEAAPVAAVDPTEVVSEPPAAWRLRGAAGPAAGRTFALTGEARVGRDAARCAIHLDEAIVSREHALLTPEGAGAWRIRRLSSTAPLLVNDQAIEEGRLGTGDRIQVGSSVLILETA